MSIRPYFLALSLLLSPISHAADIIADWGTVVTPITSEATFSFAQYDLDKNFTHLYNFSLEGSSGATYAVSFNIDPCQYGCGNPDISYGIYEANGGLLDATNGVILLSAGNYSFEVKGTGMGAGNSVDYWGNVTFALADNTMVSAAPEPTTFVLMACGLVGFLLYRIRSKFLALSALFLLTACTPKLEQASQIVAQVGNTEISQTQYNYALQRTGLSQPSTATQVEIIHKLVDRQLAAQQAQALKLEQQPEILQRLEETRRDVLAMAYAEHIAKQANKPTENQAAQYFSSHPELFAQRKIYQLSEATLAADLTQLNEVKQRLLDQQKLPHVLTWLSQQGAQFNQQNVIRAAEQLPIEALPRFNQAKVGDTVFFSSPRGIMLYQIISQQDAPINWEQAKPLIRDYLLKQAGKTAIEADLKQLKSNTAIRYLGQFATLNQ